MTSPRDLDYTPLGRGSGIRNRLRAIGGNNLWVVAGAIGVLLVVVPVVIAIALLATGNPSPDGLLMLLFLLVCGVLVLGDLLRKAGPAAGLEAFAAANSLELVRGTTARHYAGDVFASEQYAVHQSVRTRGETFVEVGECTPTTLPPDARRPNQSALFLRARLTGHTGAEPDQLVTPELHRQLTRLAGPYRVEVAGDELTVLGSRPLDPQRPGRLEEAFALAGTLVSRADAHPADATTPGSPTLSGIPLPTPSRPLEAAGKPPRPLAVLGWGMAALVAGSLAIAIVMSVVDDHLRGREVEARLVVSIIVVVTLLLVARLVRAAVSPRSGGDGSRE